ncbi:hypothetical protein SEA_CECE_232 [Microbacterium phage Cece]|nr:hypothetical protein SEA_CECE_232 [Microbacterium phage Cece]
MTDTPVQAWELNLEALDEFTASATWKGENAGQEGMDVTFQLPRDRWEALGRPGTFWITMTLEEPTNSTSIEWDDDLTSDE